MRLSTTANDAALLVDLGSVHAQLMEWRHRGDFADAPALFRAFSRDSDRWIARLGAWRDGSHLDGPVGLRDFDRRLLILPQNDLREMAERDAAYAQAVSSFEQQGFRIVISTSSPSLQLSIEMLRMQTERSLPSHVVIATAAPDAAGLLSALRTAGVRTMVAAVMSRHNSEGLQDLVDAVLDLPKLVETFGLEIEPGFSIPNGTHRAAIHERIEQILRGDAVEKDVALDEVEAELALLGAPFVASLPIRLGGLRALLADLLAEQSDGIGRDWRLVSDRLVSTKRLREVAEKVRSIAASSPRVEQGTLLTEIANVLPARIGTSGGSGQVRWLGFASFSELLKEAAAAADAGWEIDTSGPGYLRIPDLPAPPIGRPPTPDGEAARRAKLDPIGRVADFINWRLRASDKALPLVGLANDVPDVVPEADSSTNWLGHRTFLGLLRAAEAQQPEVGWIFETGVSPGYIRLERHPQPSESTSGGPLPNTVRSNVAKIRSVIPDFPNDSVSGLHLRIAVIASVLASSSAAIVCRERLRLARFAQQEGAASGLIGGRSGYTALLSSVRLEPERADAHWQKAVHEEDVWVDRRIERMLNTVAFEISQASGRSGIAPLGAARLHEIMSASLRSYLVHTNVIGDPEGLVEEVIGPIGDRPTDPARLWLLGDVAQDRLSEHYDDFVHANPIEADPADLVRLVEDLKTDRVAYLTPPTALVDAQAARNDLEAFVTDRLASGDALVRLDLLHEEFCASDSDVSDIDRLTFVQLLLEAVKQRAADSRVEGRPWALNLDIPPGAISLGETVPTSSSDTGCVAWLEHSRSFVRDSLHPRGLPVAWPEAVWIIQQRTLR